MILFVPARLVRLAFFALAAGCAGLISAEVTATTLCCLVVLAACCRGPVRLELIFAGVAGFAARQSGGDLAAFKAILIMVSPLVIALGGLYLMSRAVLGPRRHPWSSDRRQRLW